MERKFYTSRYDIPFKEIFMNNQNEDILRCLLENILRINIKKIEYLNLERNSTNIRFHRKFFDLLVETDNKKIQVEVNSSASTTDYVRNFSYICDTYAHYTLRGDDYDADMEIIQINLTYGLKDEELIRKYTIQDCDKNTFVDNLSIYELNMDKYMEFWYNGNEKEIEKNKYIIMLDLDEKDLQSLSKKDKVVTKYMEELEKINEDPEFHHYMTHEEDMRKRYNTWMKRATKEGLKQGIEQGIEQGVVQGANNKIVEIAKNMLNDGADISLIEKYTGLSKDELEKLN